MQCDIEEEVFDINLDPVVVSQLVDEEGINVALQEEVFNYGTLQQQFDVSIVEEVLSFTSLEVERVVLEPDEVQYSSRVDFVTDLFLYRGEALPGAAEGDPVWRIREITIGGDNDVTTLYADGNANFDNVWTDRASLTYS